MNYFEFFELERSFELDEGALKRKFYKKSKLYHPDFYTLASKEKQAEILELSSLNNKAFKTLSDFDSRVKYLLELEGALGAEGKNQIPQAFLMEMMDINEALMELEFDFDEKAYSKIKGEITEWEANMKKSASKHFTDYLNVDKKAASLKEIKDYYLKNRYLLRILKNLNKFAAR